jgi:hypothetical protein
MANETRDSTLMSPRKMPMQFLSFFFSAAVLLQLGFTPAAVGQRSDHVPGELLIMLSGGTDVNKFLSQYATLDGDVTRLAVERNLSRRMNIWQLRFDAASVNEARLLSMMREERDVIAVQFNHYVELRNTPDDPLFGQQWNLHNIGQVGGGTPGADIRATNAWDLATGGVTAGGDTIVIAVIDQGFDLSHEDIHYHKNYLEIPGNGIDDDENGYTDDYDGWNAIDNSGNIPSDYHGTHVTGIAGAAGNNSIGVTGINWNVQVLPVKGYSGVESIVVAGYTYVLEMRKRYNESDGAEGALIVSANSSFGINNGQPANFPLWCAMYDSMGAAGILHATATANSTVNVDVVGDMPTACPSDYMISVTNTTATDQKNPSAAYGDTTIDLGAPGTTIMSTLPGNTYGTKTGTSSASPHVAGAIALIYSLPCSVLADDYKNDPAGAALRIRDFILEGVDSLGDLSVSFPTVSGGRLNVYNSLELAAAYYDCTVGVNDLLPGSSEVVLYPNPANELLYVHFPQGLNLKKTYTIRNMLGQAALSGSMPSSSNTIAVDVSSLEAGVYLLSIQSGVFSGSYRFVKE